MKGGWLHPLGPPWHQSAAGLLILLLCGCVRPPPPAAPAALIDLRALVPVQISVNDPWPSITWWQALQVPALAALIDTALSDNPGMKRATDRLEQAQAIVKIRGADLLPLASTDARISKQRFSGDSTQAKLAGRDFFLTTVDPLSFSYHLDLWGRDRAALAAARGARDADAAELAMARLVLTAAVVRTYVKWAAVWDQSRLVAVMTETLEKSRHIRQVRIKLGLEGKAPLESIEINLAELHQRASQLELAAALLQHQLSALLGRGMTWSPMPSVAAAPTTPALELPSVLPLSLLARRPDIQAVRARAEAARQEIKIARTAFYPDINLRGVVGFETLNIMSLFQPANLVAGVGPSIVLPLFEGGRLKAALNFREAAYDEAIEAYNARLVDVVKATADALSRWTEARAHLADQAHALTAAHTTRHLAETLRQAGLADGLPPLESQLALDNARYVARAMEAELALAWVDVIESLGGGMSNGRISDE